ncbi:hypothetical protein PybrP1_010732, partial [[Pythium] brassicae (nom. inval.)]
MGPPRLCIEVAAQPQSTFELVVLGPVKFLLGVEFLIAADPMQAAFGQRVFVRRILNTFHMETRNGSRTPEATSESTAAVPAVAPGEYVLYREMVGATQYFVSASRQGIAHAVIEDMDVNVQCRTDADFANNKDGRKCISGYVTTLDGNTMLKGSRKQTISAQSNMEAEYIAMNEGTEDLLWMVGLLDELQSKHSTPELVYDNMGSIYLATKPGKHRHNKHIDNKYHLARHLGNNEGDDETNREINDRPRAAALGGGGGGGVGGRAV